MCGTGTCWYCCVKLNYCILFMWYSIVMSSIQLTFRDMSVSRRFSQHDIFENHDRVQVHPKLQTKKNTVFQFVLMCPDNCLLNSVNQPMISFLSGYNNDSGAGLMKLSANWFLVSTLVMRNITFLLASLKKWWYFKAICLL